MMNGPYKRQEGFRLVLDHPIPGTFSIKMINDQPIFSKEGSLEIQDISLGGLKFAAYLDLPLDKRVCLLVKFKIMEQEFAITGKVVWKKPAEPIYLYGFIMDKESYSKEILLKQLKLLSAQQKR